MGLDMYLRAKKYVSRYTDEESFNKLNELDLGQSDMELYEVSAEAMYWRKANAIHDWFVRECQNGVDECQETRVDLEDLKRLRDLCAEVLAKKDEAVDLLPTASGFFFGTTDYDEYYFEEVERTKNRLTKILEDDNLTKKWDFYYQSSW